MRFIDIHGVLQKARRAVSGHSSVSSEQVKDPTKLAEIIRLLSLRVSELEASTPPDAVEFELNVSGTVGAPANIKLTHGFGGPIRWWVTRWKQDPGSHAYPLIMEHTDDPSTDDMLWLECHSKGFIVIRIESSPYGVSG